MNFWLEFLKYDWHDHCFYQGQRDWLLFAKVNPKSSDQAASSPHVFSHWSNLTGTTSFPGVVSQVKLLRTTLNGQRCQSNVNHYHFMSSVLGRYTVYVHAQHQENLNQSNQLDLWCCVPLRVISHHSSATEMTPERALPYKHPHGWRPLTQSFNCPRYSAKDLTIIDSLHISLKHPCPGMSLENAQKISLMAMFLWDPFVALFRLPCAYLCYQQHGWRAQPSFPGIGQSHKQYDQTYAKKSGRKNSSIKLLLMEEIQTTSWGW